MSEYETEPIRGLPSLPPDDERMLWQGSPDGASIARWTLHGGLIALYFVGLTAFIAVPALLTGATPGEAIKSSLHLVVIGGAALALIKIIGRLIDKTTVYTITSKRIVMRIGVALPVTVNIPFSKIASADVKLHPNGTGDIALVPAEAMPLTYFHLWPHVRGLRLRHPQPVLRCIPDATAVSSLLVEAILKAGVKGEVRNLKATVTSISPMPATGIPAAA